MLTGKDVFDEPIIFKGEELKLAEESGSYGVQTYQYFKSGRENGTEDYIQILVVDKSEFSPEELKELKDFLRKGYNFKPILHTGGEFGVFHHPSEVRDYYAYLFESESSARYWYINYIVQSNFLGNSIEKSEAREATKENIGELKSIVSSISQKLDGT